MQKRLRGRRRDVSLLVSVSLVLLLGGLGLWAGGAAGSQAMRVHRGDRLALQRTLADLTAQYTQVLGAEVLDILATQDAAGVTPWHGTPGDAADADRLRSTAHGSRALNAGAILIGPTGSPLNASAAASTLPPPTDPGWQPFRAAVVSGRHTLPVSGVLQAGGRPVVAVGVPVALPGETGLLVGLSVLQTSSLQRYVADLRTPDGRRGYVIDARGLVLAAPSAAEVGRPLAYPAVQRVVRSSASDLRDVREGDQTLTTSWSAARDTGWTALTLQDTHRFAGPLRTAARRAQGALVLLLLIVGACLVLLHRKRETALVDVAVSDELTGVYNRRGWFAVAQHELEVARRAGTRRGLLFVDLDGLKHVNDALGHREGDRAIADAAQVLRGCARSSDVLGRLGGDEFVLLLADDGPPDVVRARVRAALDAHNALSDAGFELRMSIGAEVWYPETATTLEELVQRADGQMYAEKVARPARHEGLVRL